MANILGKKNPMHKPIKARQNAYSRLMFQSENILETLQKYISPKSAKYGGDPQKSIRNCTFNP